MAYTRAMGKLTFDNPHADGLLTVGGFGKDWAAPSDGGKQKQPVPGRIFPDIAVSTGWQLAGQFEYVRSLQAIGPIGSWTKASMEGEEPGQAIFHAKQGKWKLSAESGSLQTKYLHYYDAEPNRFAAGAWGIAESLWEWGPNLLIQVWRSPASPGEEDVPNFGIHFANNRYYAEYALVFPAPWPGDAFWKNLTGREHDAVLKPSLLGKLRSEETWTVIAQMDNVMLPVLREVGQAPTYQTIRVECEAGKLVVAVNGMMWEWAYSGGWTDEASGERLAFELGGGFIEFWALGGPVKVLAQQMLYPTEATLIPDTYVTAAYWQNQTPTYRAPLAEVPDGTSLEVAVEEKPNDPAWTRPKITFKSTDGARRALFYCLQEYRPPTISAGTSEPYSTGDETRKLIELSGTIAEKWRGSTCKATIVSETGQPVVWPPANAKVQADVSVTDGATWVRQFTGHVMPPTLERPERVVATRYIMEAKDIVEARLAHKQLGWLCSFDRWPAGEAFRAVCNCAGIPDNKIDVSMATAILGRGDLGKRKMAFRPDALVPSVLDDIAKAVGYEWGQDQNGVLFLRPPLEHERGHYDYVVDETSVDIRDIVSQIRSTLSYQDFANYLEVIIGEGPDSIGKTLLDLDSAMTPGALRFIGDLWQRFSFMPEGTDLDAICKKLWDDLGRWSHVVEWTMHDRPEIMPDQYVLFRCSGLRLEYGTVCRVVSKQWWADLRSGMFTQTLVGKVEEVLEQA